MFALTSSALAIVATVASHCPTAPSAIALAVVGQRTPIAVGAADEAARLWAPYGVSIETLGSVGVHGMLVHVRFAAPPDGSSDARALGTIEFHDGVPDPDVTLYPQRAWTLIVRTVGPAANGWPLSYRDQVLGRVLGRALAHELGHFLLQMPAHTVNGLMRAVQPIVNLMDGTRSAFTLSADEIAVLQARNRCGSGPSN
ncbi:MAG TPA: hypothetical protein VL262_12025 [Vicinamibacterales bacterium]|nr:hypothetical protein [Vicinamibacterales bacterium]